MATVVPFHIEREGPAVMEVATSADLLQWRLAALATLDLWSRWDGNLHSSRGAGSFIDLSFRVTK